MNHQENKFKNYVKHSDNIEVKQPNEDQDSRAVV